MGKEIVYYSDITGNEIPAGQEHIFIVRAGVSLEDRDQGQVDQLRQVREIILAPGDLAGANAAKNQFFNDLRTAWITFMNSLNQSADAT